MSAAVLGLALASTGATASGEKVRLCHKGTKVIEVSERALRAHMNHGDIIADECPNPLEEMRELTERLLVSCNRNDTTMQHEVKAVTASTGITTTLDLGAVTNCAEALHLVDAAGCEELNMSGTPEDQTYTFACPSSKDDPLVETPPL